MARPELLDAGPAWGGGKLNATNVLLEPLAPDETAELLARRSASGVDGQLRDADPRGRRGQPALRRGDGRAGARRRAARSRCRRRSRRCSRPGSTSSTRPSAACSSAARSRARSSTAAPSLALAPEEPQVDGRLVALVRKELVRPEQPRAPGDDAYRFRHLLIRDAAYEALPKATRAELHERFAGWLERARRRPGRAGRDRRLPPRAGVPLPGRARPARRPAAARAGRAGGQAPATSAERALERGDQCPRLGAPPAHGRALPRRTWTGAGVQLDLAVALAEQGEFDEAAAALADAEAAARAAGESALLAAGRASRIEHAIQTDPRLDHGRRGRDSSRGAGRARTPRRREGAIWALRLLGNFMAWLGNKRGGAEAYWEQALERGGLVSPRQVNDIAHLDAVWCLVGLHAGRRWCASAMRCSAPHLVEAARGGTR